MNMSHLPSDRPPTEGPRPLIFSEFEELEQFLGTIFPTSSAGRYGLDYPTMIHPGNRAWLWVCTDEEHIVAHAGMQVVQLACGPMDLVLGNIGAVATADQYRGLGLSSSILTALRREAVRAGIDLLLLWSEKFDFYHRLGYHPAGTELLYQIRPPVYAQKPIGWRSPEPIDREPLLELYHRHDLGVRRDLSRMNLLLNIPETTVRCCGPLGAPIAYIVADKGADLLDHIHEWGGDPEAIASCTTYLAFAQQRMLTLHAPSSSTAALPCFESRFGPPVAHPLALVHLVDPVGLCARILHTMGTLLDPSQPIPALLEILFGPPGQYQPTAPLALYIWGLDSA